MLQPPLLNPFLDQKKVFFKPFLGHFQGPEEGNKALVTGVTVLNSLMWVLGIKLKSSIRASVAFNHWAICGSSEHSVNQIRVIDVWTPLLYSAPEATVLPSSCRTHMFVSSLPWTFSDEPDSVLEPTALNTPEIDGEHT